MHIQLKHFAGVIRETRRRWRGEEPGDERNAGADLEAGTPMSRRNSNASFGTGGAMSKTLSTTSRTSRGVSSRGMSRRSSNSDATLSRRISVSSIPSRGSLGSNSSQKPWWKRISGKLFPTKRKRRRRRGSRVEDSAYDMSKYEDANLRAMAAMIEPVSTFSPMQVRNLHVAHLPSVVAAEPPTQLAPYLPGTPAGLVSICLSVGRDNETMRRPNVEGELFVPFTVLPAQGASQESALGIRFRLWAQWQGTSACFGGGRALNLVTV
eukprot:g25755.t1